MPDSHWSAEKRNIFTTSIHCIGLRHTSALSLNHCCGLVFLHNTPIHYDQTT